ncbi:MAG: SurA N-terminal domain-containing protein [Parvibaculum sp.]
MLNFLRNHASGWVAKILIGLLVMAFAVWGIADVFRGFTNTTILTAGDTEIPADRFAAEYRQRLNEFAERIGQPLSAAEGRKYGIDRRVISQLAGSAVLSEEASDLGIAISDALVAADIRGDENFFGAFGKFDRQTYDMALAQAQISEAAFVNDRREFIARDQLLKAVAEGATVPAGLAEAMYEYQYETRTARYIVLPPDLVSEIEDPAEDVITEYYAQASNRFTKEETRSFAVLTVKPSDIAPTIGVDDAQLLQAFEDRRGLLDKPETRTLIQIPLADAEAAADVSVRLKAGEALETILAEKELSLDDVTLKDVTERGFLSPDIAEKAFSMSVGEVSDAIDGPLAHVVLRVENITAAAPAVFEEHKDEVRKALVEDEAADAVFDLYNTIEDERAGGASLAEIASRFSLEVVTIDEATQTGLTRAGQPPANMPNIPGLIAEVYENDVGIETPANELADGGYYWVEVTGVTPAEVKPLDEVRGQVLDLWKREKRKLLLDELAQSLVERGNAGTSIDALAAEHARAAQASTPMLRRFSNDTFSRIGVNGLFGSPDGGFSYALAGFGDSMVVMQVTKIETPEPGNGTDGLDEIQAALSERAGDDLIASLVTALQEKHVVEVNYGLLDQMIGDASGS